MPQRSFGRAQVIREGFEGRPVVAASCGSERSARPAVEFHLLMASSVIVLAPVIAAFFVAQKQFIRGIALTGLKG